MDPRRAGCARATTADRTGRRGDAVVRLFSPSGPEQTQRLGGPGLAAWSDRRPAALMVAQPDFWSHMCMITVYQRWRGCLGRRKLHTGLRAYHPLAENPSAVHRCCAGEPSGGRLAALRIREVRVAGRQRWRAAGRCRYIEREALRRDDMLRGHAIFITVPGALICRSAIDAPWCRPDPDSGMAG